MVLTVFLSFMAYRPSHIVRASITEDTRPPATPTHTQPSGSLGCPHSPAKIVSTKSINSSVITTAATTLSITVRHSHSIHPTNLFHLEHLHSLINLPIQASHVSSTHTTPSIHSQSYTKRVYLIKIRFSHQIHVNM